MRLALHRRMSKINSYKDLQVWRLGMDLVDACFNVVELVPDRHRFIFCNQLSRAAISTPSNIAEGSRRPRRAYLNHLSIALGSCAELETLLEILRRRRLVALSAIDKAVGLTESVSKMLHALVRSLEV